MNNRINHFFDRPDDKRPTNKVESKPYSGKFEKALIIADSWYLKTLDVFVGDTPGNLLTDLRAAATIFYLNLTNPKVCGTVAIVRNHLKIDSQLTNGNEQQLTESLTKALAGEPFIGTKMILRDRWFLKASTHPMNALFSERVQFADCSKRIPFRGRIWIAEDTFCWGNIAYSHSRDASAETVGPLMNELQSDVLKEQLSNREST